MNEKAESASDIPAGNWVDQWLPPAARPYARLARLDRPIGTWLLLIPCWWGDAIVTAAAGGTPNLWHFLLYAIGALVMRGAGCTWNDLMDRDFDAKVARTALRPIPSGDVSVRQAIVFLIVQALIGLCVLSFFNITAIVVGVASLGLVAIYPLMKRVTYWPQAFLGLTFNWGILVGWAAETGTLHPAAFILYAAGFFWTLGYDTIYAHQDKDDDILIGVKSSALRLGGTTRPFLFVFYAITILLMAAIGYLIELSSPYFIGLALGAMHLIWQAAKVDIDNPADCLMKFKSNRDFALIILAGIIASGLWP